MFRLCALALLLCAHGTLAVRARAQDGDLIRFQSDENAAAFQLTAYTDAPPHITAMPIASDMPMMPVGEPGMDGYAYAQDPQAQPGQEVWISPPGERMAPPVGADYGVTDQWGDPVIADDFTGWGSGPWVWQVMPDGLIYRSYWAGVHEPRLSVVAMHEKGSESFWDGTVGGRVGLLRYGTVGTYFPQGWQLDVEAAAILRLTLDEIRDFEYADYRIGVPITYGVENWQYKFGAYHLSSHMGDEYAIANPGSLNDRINYVRDALVLGVSWYPVSALRLYSEAAYAFNVDGGAKPWEFQFGFELSRPGPTGVRGTPFWAANAHLREEHDFGGDINTQLGWLWRGESGQVTRFGLHYFNGKSSQYQVFDDSEQQIGVGLWYDY